MYSRLFMLSRLYAVRVEVDCRRRRGMYDSTSERSTKTKRARAGNEPEFTTQE